MEAILLVFLHFFCFFLRNLLPYFLNFSLTLFFYFVCIYFFHFLLSLYFVYLWYSDFIRLNFHLLFSLFHTTYTTIWTVSLFIVSIFTSPNSIFLLILYRIFVFITPIQVTFSLMLDILFHSIKCINNLSCTFSSSFLYNFYVIFMNCIIIYKYILYCKLSIIVLIFFKQLFNVWIW